LSTVNFCGGCSTTKAPGLSVQLPQRQSCTDNLCIAYGEIIKALIKHKGTTVDFLNMKAAYNNVLPDILDEKLKKCRKIKQK
jgi:hypothetical protein